MPASKILLVQVKWEVVQRRCGTHCCGRESAQIKASEVALDLVREEIQHEIPKDKGLLQTWKHHTKGFNAYS